MVLSVIKGLGKAYLKSQAKTIKSIAPFSKTGAKTISEIKAAASAAKLKTAVFDIKQSLSKTSKKKKETQ